MATDRRDMTVRVVPLRSAEAGDSQIGGTVAERPALVEVLSEQQWALTGRPLPTYTRATMPINVTTLRALTSNP
jgi:hypothetical protein